MRFVVYGLGAVGGTIAVRLALSGAEVAGIARGRMLEAVQAQGGLTLISHAGTETGKFACFADPSEMGLRPDDVILLTMKSQDTEPALRQLAAAGLDGQPVICAQNGVANERAALRHFATVYGMTVMLPAQYTRPGEVICFGAPKPGLFDLGRYPSGSDARVEEIGAALRAAGFGCWGSDQVMASKYGKLLMNLGNILGAAFGEAARHGPLYDRVKDEGIAVLRAAGIGFEDVGLADPRRAEMKIEPIEGVTRTGSSSVQSLARGTGSIETDYLNGEIVLIGRLNGRPAPVNAALCEVARRMVAGGMAPGSFPMAEFETILGGLDA